MKPYESLKIENTKKHIMGQDLDLDITIYVYRDDALYYLDWEFDSDDERQRLEQMIEKGEVTPSYVELEIKAIGISGSAVLGGVLVSNMNDVFDTITDYDLFGKALESLELSIKDELNSAKELIKKFN